MKLVAFEAGHSMTWIAETVKTLTDVQVPMGQPNKVTGITESRGKTDRVAAKKLAELARAGLLSRAVPVGEGRVRARREVVSAWHHLQSKRLVWIQTIRGYVDQEGDRLPEQCVVDAAWWEQRARLPLSTSLKLIVETFMTSLEALVATEQQLTERLVAIQAPRCPLLECIPAIGPLAAYVLVSAGDEARRVDDQKAVVPDGGAGSHDVSDFSERGSASNSGPSIGMGGWRCAGSCSTVPIQWYA